ncbi:MAG: tRNA (adenosine(37)-N6)-threonylcarbamoyltransferase complex transferase subunit TsaD [Candidatus Micrarchaeota archaeon]|nr:tRNA (adenosine(37)-N6)-threonylcarbamoyltransferase complex transferase subunit TsaD [Candidatus Micrarchaeota archaeon]
MPVMGIESSAHTLGVGIVHSGKVLANEKAMFRITDKGLIPSRVADFHSKNVGKVIRSALKSAGLKMSDIDAIGYTRGPGLGPCLRVGELVARSIHELLGIPLFAVNHAVAHIEITRTLSKVRDPLALYVSGGNSQIIGAIEDGFRHYHVYGETFDIGAGNMIDNFARAAKMKPAWGSTVAKVAEGGKYIQLPYTVKGMDFTFTGLLTHATKLLATNDLKDVAYSLQETAFAMLCEATERALLLTKKKDLLLCGGVAQSRRLQAMLKSMTRAHGIGFHVAPDQYNADNGAMIAIVAEEMLNSDVKQSSSDFGIDQRYRIDSVRLPWL